MSAIEIPWVIDKLSHSIIYEEYKGDFAEARKIAEHALKQKGQASDKSQQADALIACGVVSLLQGEPQAAMRFLDQVDRLVPKDSTRRYRAAIFANLATFRQFNTFPGESGAGAIEIALRWDGKTDLAQQEMKRKELLAKLIRPVAVIENELVTGLLTNCLMFRNMLDGLPNLTPEQSGQLLNIAIQTVSNYLNNLKATGDPGGLMAYTTWTLADLHRRSGQLQPARRLILQAYQLYLQAGDLEGMAITYLSRGDWLSAPYSNPVALNFAIQNSDSLSSELSLVIENLEFNQQGLDLANARAAYTQAEQLFQQAHARRGLATILLRRAYLAMLEKDFPTALRLAAQGRDTYEASGDIQGIWTARAHCTLYRVGAGEFPEDSATAAAIGSWGTGDGSFSFALGLGLLFGRAGRHWLTREGDFERSLACYRLAETLFAALGAVNNRIQSLVDQGEVYQAAGDMSSALIFYEQALDVHAANLAANPRIPLEIQNQFLLLAMKTYNLCLTHMQADGMERCARRLEGLLTQAVSGSATAEDYAALTGFQINLILSLDPTFVAEFEKKSDAAISWLISTQIHEIIQEARTLVPVYRAVRSRYQGDELAASQYFNQAMAAANQENPPIRYYLESVIFGHQKDYPSAADRYHQYMAEEIINLDSIDKVIQNMASMGNRTGMELANRETVRKLELAFIYLTRFKVFPEAHRYLNALIQYAGNDWWRSDWRTWVSLSDYGDLYLGLEQYEQAIGIL